MDAWPTDGLAARVERTSLTDKVSEALAALILELGLKDGDPVPSAERLSERFGVSRTVVRESIASLAGKGILRRESRGYTVAAPGSDELTGLLSFRIRYDNIDDLHVQEFREALEIWIARLAAERRLPKHLAAMAIHLEDMARASTDEQFHSSDVAFHRDLAEAAANPLLLLALDSLGPLLKETRIKASEGWRTSGKTMEPVLDAHREILRMVQARDLDGTARAMEVHLQQTREGLELQRASALN